MGTVGYVALLAWAIRFFSFLIGSFTGLDFIYAAITATATHKNLEWWHGLFGTAGRWTLETRAVNQRIVITADPENIKAILATQFVDFGKGEPFHRDWQDFLGDSIFTTDGERWHNSRQLIRPQFTRDRVSDLECFEKHMQTLFRAIANGGPLDGADQVVSSSANGKVLDIADLFFRYTLDVATEFLLGSDVQSLTCVIELNIPPWTVRLFSFSNIQQDY